MIFFDFLYYATYRFYSGYNEKGAKSSAAGIVGGFQVINILTVIMLFQLAFQQKGYINKLLVVVLFIVFQITTYFRYIYKSSHSVDVIESKWLGKSEAFRKQMNNAIFLYVALSIIISFGLAIYLGGKH